jgi:hypothetical protein
MLCCIDCYIMRLKDEMGINKNYRFNEMVFQQSEPYHVIIGLINPKTMKKTLLAFALCCGLFYSCADKKNDQAGTDDSTKTTPAPPMKAGDRTSDGGH